MGTTEGKRGSKLKKRCTSVRCRGKITNHSRKLRDAVGLDKRVLVCDECGKETTE